MKLSTPLYEGDSIIRRGPEPADATGSREDSTSIFVQRNDPSARKKIEAEARAARAATVALCTRRLSRWLAAKLDRARRGHEEAYLAQADSLSEVERRMRELERGSLMRI